MLINDQNITKVWRILYLKNFKSKINLVTYMCKFIVLRLRGFMINVRGRVKQ